MSDTKQAVADARAEYDRLARESEERFGSKARKVLEQQLREEMKRRLNAASGDAEKHKAAKGAAALALHAAKLAHRDALVAGVASGTVDEAGAADEIVALGWERAVALQAIADARAEATAPRTEDPATPPAADGGNAGAATAGEQGPKPSAGRKHRKA